MLLELIQTKVNYVVQEAIIVIRDIFRRYPNQAITITLLVNPAVPRSRRGLCFSWYPLWIGCTVCSVIPDGTECCR